MSNRLPAGRDPSKRRAIIETFPLSSSTVEQSVQTFPAGFRLISVVPVRF